jgi:hypothetical protein
LAPLSPRPAGPKVFWFFFSKKNVLLPSKTAAGVFPAAVLFGGYEKLFVHN